MNFTTPRTVVGGVETEWQIRLTVRVPQYRERCSSTEGRKSPVSRSGLACPFPSH
jgi:hypothetical protein